MRPDKKKFRQKFELAKKKPPPEGSGFAIMIMKKMETTWK
jgi:hypothetical protein